MPAPPPGDLPSPPPDPSRCPLCGRPNACAMAAGAGSTAACWCAQVDASEAVALRLREADHGACACRSCLRGDRDRSAEIAAREAIIRDLHRRG